MLLTVDSGCGKDQNLMFIVSRDLTNQLRRFIALIAKNFERIRKCIFQQRLLVSPSLDREVPNSRIPVVFTHPGTTFGRISKKEGKDKSTAYLCVNKTRPPVAYQNINQRYLGGLSTNLVTG